MKPAERQGAQGKQTANQDCLVGFSRIRTPGTRDLAYIWSGKVLQLRGVGKQNSAIIFTLLMRHQGGSLQLERQRVNGSQAYYTGSTDVS